MDDSLKERFQELWNRYFDDAELPIILYYTDKKTVRENDPETSSYCLIACLNKVRNGTSLRFNTNSIGCPGGKRYAGFNPEISENFEHFLSYGIPDVMEGERYKQSPELVKNWLKDSVKYRASSSQIVFKRWDHIDEDDEPEAVIFFARPDVLSGLFTLANYDLMYQGVIAPFGSGCSSIIMYPILEGEKEHPHCIFGMFDPSARPYVERDTLTFAVPMKRFTQMVENMTESFLITPTWDTIKKRLKT
ncbi:MAG: DUF169 domain-containing protein [Candidatus Bathyarchaeota archaeon]|nr:DUF169 domain-containing protein [Candidatus Bathyarchaeota archaeon]